MRYRRHLALVLLLTLQALLSSAYAESPALVLKARTEGGTVRIELSSKARLHFRAKTTTTPHQAILVDVFPARLLSRFECAVNAGLIKRVGALQQDANTVRVTIDSLQLPKYSISRGDEGVNLLIETDTTISGQACPAKLAPPPETHSHRAKFDEPQSDFVSISWGNLDKVKAFLEELVPGTQFVVDPEKGGLQVSGHRLALQQIREVVEVFDELPCLALLDVEIAYVPEYLNAHRLWFSSDRPFLESDGLTWTEFGEYPARSEAVRGPVEIGWERCQADRISTFLESSGARILGHFSFGVVAGKPSLANFGEKLPVLYFNPNSGQFQIQYANLGIKLSATATRGDNGGIDCELTTEARTLQAVMDDQFPYCKIRQVSESWHFQDGESIVISGLFENPGAQMPCLRELPILGPILRVPILNAVILIVTRRERTSSVQYDFR